MSRPTKLTSEIGQKIIELIQAGNYAATAAAAAGVNEGTFYRWMARGQEAPTPPEEPVECTIAIPHRQVAEIGSDEKVGRLALEIAAMYDFETFEVISRDDDKDETIVRIIGWPEYPDRLYREFREAVKAAEAKAEVDAVQAVHDGFRGNWQAAMTYLERRHPQKWRRRETVYEEAPPPPDVMEKLLVDPEARALAAELEERLSDNGPEEDVA